MKKKIQSVLLTAPLDEGEDTDDGYKLFFKLFPHFEVLM